MVSAITLKSVLFSLVLVTVLSGTSYPAPDQAPAGSVLESHSEVYFNGIVKRSKPLYIKVPQIYGIFLTPKEVKINVKPGIPAHTPVRLDNLGNGTDKVTVRFDQTQTNLRLRLLVDENKDGIYQPSETEEVEPAISLPEGSALNFFVEVVAPQKARSGEWTWAAVTARSSKPGVSSYMGYNGVKYGGSEKVSSMITVYVE